MDFPQRKWRHKHIKDKYKRKPNPEQEPAVIIFNHSAQAINRISSIF